MPASPLCSLPLPGLLVVPSSLAPDPVEPVSPRAHRAVLEPCRSGSVALHWPWGSLLGQEAGAIDEASSRSSGGSAVSPALLLTDGSAATPWAPCGAPVLVVVRHHHGPGLVVLLHGGGQGAPEWPIPVCGLPPYCCPPSPCGKVAFVLFVGPRLGPGPGQKRPGLKLLPVLCGAIERSWVRLPRHPGLKGPLCIPWLNSAVVLLAGGQPRERGAVGTIHRPFFGSPGLHRVRHVLRSVVGGAVKREKLSCRGRWWEGGSEAVLDPSLGMGAREIEAVAFGGRGVGKCCPIDFQVVTWSARVNLRRRVVPCLEIICSKKKKTDRQWQLIYVHPPQLAMLTCSMLAHSPLYTE